MRFFLINHVGKAGGVETGMETEAEPFPAQVTFSGRPFALTDPRKTDNHSIISLRGGDHGAKLPSEAKEIKIGKKANKLWFLHATGWAPKEPNAVVAKYIVHYEDGTQAEFPIRFGVEVGDYWIPQPLGAATVAWTGRNLVHSPVGIFCTEWNNPFPEKAIATIDLIGNLAPTRYVLVAVTGGTLGVFAWATLEPEEGRYEFGWMDDIFERAQKQGVNVILATPSGAKPNWLSLKYPEIRRVTADGVRDPQKGRHNHCWTSPIYR